MSSHQRRSHLIPRSPGTVILIIWFVICFAAIQWPGWLIANRVEPYVLGLPFMFFWAILWWLLLIATIIYVAAKGIGE